MNEQEKIDSSIAIVGMAGRFPKARSVEEFWQNLRAGTESISFFTDAELRAAGSRVPANRPDFVKARGVLDDVELFDNAFFGMNPKEAEATDPQQRIFLECAWEALERAGYDPARYRGAVGVFAGSSMNTYLPTHLATRPDLLELLGPLQVQLSNDKDFLTTRVSYKLNLRGPSLNIQTGCSTSLVTVCVACQHLLNYQCDLALAGGVSITLPQRAGYFYQEGGINSVDGHTRAFDAQATGTAFGDGVGVVVLRRLADALADGDQVLAIIKGFAINNDGAQKVGFAAPSVEGQAEVIALAHAMADIDPGTIGYVEAHGTATPLGDPIEVTALTKAFRARTDAKGFCALGSVKTNIGHLDVAAGIAGLMKTVLALQHRELPASLHFTTPNPQIDFSRTPFYVNSTLTGWRAGATPRRAGVSAFGVGGTNAHVVLEEAGVPAAPVPARPYQLLVLSAQTSTALAQVATNLAAQLQAHPELPLADVAFTLQTGRREFAYRRTLVCADVAEAIRLLSAGGAPPLEAPAAAPVAFMFPGQGAQQAGMGRQLYEAEAVFRRTVDRCAELSGMDLRALLFTGSAEELAQTQFTQPALFVVEYALAQQWLAWGVRPTALVGHSIGEYVAACLAGVLTLEDALRLVAVRGRLMQALPGGAMLAVRLPEAELVPLLGPELSLATVNGVTACVAAGPTDAIQGLENTLKARGVAVRRLATSHAFHSAMMEEMAGEFLEIVKQTKRGVPQIPYLSNVTGTWITATEVADPAYWFKHLRTTVRFADNLATLAQEPHRILLEVGPGQTLAQLARQHPARAEEQVVIAAHANPEGMLAALGKLWAAGAVVDWAGFYGTERRRRVVLPTYPFERQRCWIDSVPVAQAAPVGLPAVVPVRDQLVDELRGLLGELTGRDYRQVDVRATFMELGAESLFLSQFALALAKRYGVKIAFRQLFGELATLDALAQYMKASAGAARGEETPVAVPAATAVQTVPLTEVQQEVWLATILSSEASCAFNLSCTVRLRGALQPAALERALQQLVNRHEGLRATFSAAGDRQQIVPELPVGLPVRDWTEMPAPERDAALARVLAAESAQPFDLEHGPAVRAQLLRWEAQEHVLLFTVHHIVSDGRSLELLLHELGELYSAEGAGRSPRLPAARSFSAYAREDLIQRQRPERAVDETYWRQQFAEEPPALELPTDQPRPATKTYRGWRMGVELAPALSRALREASARRGCTLFTTLLAAYYVFLHRLTGQEDLVVGVPMAGPGVEGSNDLVAHTVNYLPMRSRLAGNPPWEEYLESVQRLVLATHEHRQFTYGNLIQKLNVAREASRLLLVSAGFTLTHARQALEFAGLTAELTQNPNGYTNVDLTFDFTVTGDAVLLETIHNPDLFETATIQRWHRQFVTLLEALVAEPRVPIGEAALVDAAARRQLLVEWNDTGREYPLAEARLHRLFEAQVARTPEAPAVVFESEQLSYAELNRRANQLAHTLRGLGVGPDRLVGICAERSVELVVGLLGILKAGGAYVPLDPEYPADRLAYMVRDANVPVLLTQDKFRTVLPAHNAHVICLERSAEASDANLADATMPDNLAYMIYTSGSTGRPKGALNTHRGICNRLLWMQEQYQLGPADTVLQKTPFSFDVSVWEFFWPLLTGARLVVARPGGHQDPEYLVNLVMLQKITVLHFVPSMLPMFLEVADAERCGSLRHVMCSGEALPAELPERCLAKLPAQLHNLYGPTEAAVDVTHWTCQRDGARRVVPIGRPVANTQCYILDARLQPVPVGVAGELHLGGVQVGRGYHRQPELTAAKFIPDPFGNVPGARLYKTGDRARYRPDGNIEYLGRFDDQVKIRGFRIELGEIQAALEQLPAVREAVVVAREDGPGDKQLVAYLVAPAPQPTVAELREFLGKTLPNYMVPTAFVFLEKVPLSPNGKVERRALPAPTASARAFTAPRTATEHTVAGAWCEVLHVPRVGIHDNFFELGGHSLLAVQVVSRLRKTLAIEFPMRTMFDRPTVAELAGHLDNVSWIRQTSQRLEKKTGADVLSGEL